MHWPTAVRLKNTMVASDVTPLLCTPRIMTAGWMVRNGTTYNRIAAFCRTAAGVDLSCAMLDSGTVARLDRHWNGHRCQYGVRPVREKDRGRRSIPA